VNYLVQRTAGFVVMVNEWLSPLPGKNPVSGGAARGKRDGL
jgi:hypothetical protein